MSTSCPTPEYHETHRYCPSCDWREETLAERMERSSIDGPLVHSSNLAADTPVFHNLTVDDEGNKAPICDMRRPTLFWRALHIKHAAKIGVACDVCFPPSKGS